jgi:glycosyltransferase involved in cell wall biosynthesis
MKKIAIVIAELVAGGGAEKVAADLAEEFSQRQYEVTIVTFADLLPHEARHAVPARFVHFQLPEQRGGIVSQMGLLLRRAWSFRQFFRQERFDHVFAFLEAANAPCVLACDQAVLSVHCNPEHMTRNDWRVFRWLYPRARRVIAVSRQIQDLLEHQARLRNVSCIYNPINTRLLNARAQEPVAVEGNFLLAVGRLEDQKRFALLIDAFALSRASQYCKLLIVGEGSQYAMLAQRITALGLEQQVSLVGFDANPYKYMARARFLVMSSAYEGYPLVLIEALSLGCPVVATDCPTGPREIINHGYNGLLVENGNPQALAEGIDTLFFDDGLRTRMSHFAPQSVRDNDIAVVADAWLAA